MYLVTAALSEEMKYVLSQLWNKPAGGIGLLS